MGHHTKKHLGATVHDGGVDFCVWAPFAKDASLLQWRDFEWEATPMQSDGKGYWELHDVDAAPGQLYKYRFTSATDETLDRNDPYARQLTGSDNGSSVIIDPAFEWEGAEAYVTTPHNEAIIYELHIGTFNKPDASTSGTFASAIEKLDYLVGLGVNYVELMPVTSMADSHGWGYSPNYIFSIENTYGGRHGLLEFVKACHHKGIGVIIDVVYNHFFKETDLWQYDGWQEHDRGGIYFYNDERGDTPWGGRPDYGRSEVRQFILDNVAMWFSEYNIDGMRVDSTIYMRNSDGNNDKPDLDIPDAWSLLAEVNNLARKINPHALMIAEDNATNAAIVSSSNDGGMGFDAQWEVGFPHVIRDALGISHQANQAPLDGITWALTHGYTDRMFDRVVFADSHDTAANGAARLNEEITPGNAESFSARQRVLIASALTLTTSGIPMLLQGQEFMQEGAFNEWQQLEWDKTEQFAGIVTAHRHLIDLRLNKHGNTRGLLGTSTEIVHRDDENLVIAYLRKDTGGARDDTVVLINFGPTTFTDYQLTLPYEGRWWLRFNSYWKGYSVDFHDSQFDAAQADSTGAATIPLAAYSVMILSCE
jgi:1,4-alpha-glucan branching enzyme